MLAGKSFVIVDTAGKRVYQRPSVEYAIGLIRSVQFCQVQGRLLLAIGGEDPDYAGTKTDLFDSTPLAKQLDLRLAHDPEVPYFAGL